MINRRCPNIIIPFNREVFNKIGDGTEEFGSYFVFPINESDMYHLYDFFDMLNKKFKLYYLGADEQEIIEDFSLMSKIIEFLKEYNEKDYIEKYYKDNLILLLNKAIEMQSMILFYF